MLYKLSERGYYLCDTIMHLICENIGYLQKSIAIA